MSTFRFDLKKGRLVRVCGMQLLAERVQAWVMSHQAIVFIGLVAVGLLLGGWVDTNFIYAGF